MKEDSKEEIIIIGGQSGSVTEQLIAQYGESLAEEIEQNLKQVQEAASRTWRITEEARALQELSETFAKLRKEPRVQRKPRGRKFNTHYS